MDHSEYRPPREPLVPPGGMEIFARDMTATMAADVPLVRVQEKLAEVGQWLPIDGDPTLPVGQLVEMNSTGPLRLGYGAWRDLLLGCQFTNGRGQLVTAGGRTVKNVAGYDLTKFMVAQQGIFGEIVTITTRTYKRPDAALIARFPCEVGLVNRLLPTSCRPQWIVLDAKGLHCGYVGDAAMIEFIDHAIAEFSPIERRRVDPPAEVAERFELWDAPVRSVTVAFRASVPPARVAEFVDKAKPAVWAAEAAFGIIQGSNDFSLVRSEAGVADGRSRAVEAARAVGGSLYETVCGRYHGHPARGVGHDLLIRLKEAFDPDGQLFPLAEYHA